MAVKNRLPGIEFQAQTPTLEEVLPRMDIAAFVGLAQSGPVDTPVPVEDFTQFREIFGDNLTLAWDPSTGQMQYAYLAPAVKSFFSNGGRRCWVVRVARDAKYNYFPLSGLLGVENWQRALGRACSRGSWSDPLRVGTVLQSQPLAVVDFNSESEESKNYYVDLDNPPVNVQRGDLLKLSFGNKYIVLFLVADSIEFLVFRSDETEKTILRVRGTKVYCFLCDKGESLASPPKEATWVGNDEGMWLLEESEGVKKAKDWQAEGSPPRLPNAERLELELLVWKGKEIHSHLKNLAFSAENPRFWANLPVDEDLFQLPFHKAKRKVKHVLNFEASEPRFPLSGPEKQEELYLPIGMSRTSDPSTSQGPLKDVKTDTRQERNGLKEFSPKLFIDFDLSSVGTGALLTKAHHKLYQQGKPLLGLHCLLPIEEITLIALPDALQRDWKRIKGSVVGLLLAPKLEREQQPKKRGAFVLKWTKVAEDATYSLQESTDPIFKKPLTIYKGKKITKLVQSRRNCQRRYYYRVRAKQKAKISPWSNTLEAIIPYHDFEDCQVVSLEAPKLDLILSTSPLEEGFSLSWSSIAGATSYILQESSDPAFDDVRIVFEGKNSTFHIKDRDKGIFFYRIRAESKVSSPWSNTQSFVTLPREEWMIKHPEVYDDSVLLAVQRALLRFCAARGDLLGVLALPSHYHKEEALSHVAALLPPTRGYKEDLSGYKKTKVMPLTGGEKQVFSFAALYHPWIWTYVEESQDSISTRLVPPDGAVCGMMAARAITRGAWIAPANEPLEGIVSLEPKMDLEEWSCLFNTQLNLILQDPRGFLPLSANTLSQEKSLQLINVRRLLIFLRRLALREGSTYVFQPNDDSFRRLVQNKFEQVLTSLYTQGAFAGETPAASFRVVADSSINTPESLEQGRFVVELRVAPSRPIDFITIRLVQTAYEGLTIQEV